MTDLLKKNWFVVVVAVLFAGIAVFFAYDQNKDKLAGKTENGAGVVFAIDGKNFTADDLYDEYYKAGGADAAYMLMQRIVLDAYVETTDDLKKEAEDLAADYEAYFQNQYGVNAQEYLEYNLKAMGLDTLYDYCLYNIKLENMISEYLKENAETLYPAFAEAYKPRFVSHVLVKMDNPDAPTAEETKRFEEVKEAWENRGDMDFGTFAQTYSDDTGSAIQQGSIGYTDINSSLVETFHEAALALEEGEVSEWIKSEYGYHLITVTSTKMEDVMNDVSFLESYLTFDSSFESNLMWTKLQEKNVSFADPELEASIKSALGIEEAAE
ncbi:MAG: peptidylprolyl isomerase [Erysipelotrichaceae bacterium]|nr:peptidylprolyl isomerase [Erysipelotrichaceae bacterium]